jgi:UDP-N-acetylglucosamine acyltransferase
VGLERRGFSPESLKRLRKVFKIFYLQNLTVSQAIEKIVVEVGREPEVDAFLNFLDGSKNGILR